jgi:hypothetical protein
MKSEAVGGMKIGRGNRKTRREPTPVLLCLPQIPQDLAWDRTREDDMNGEYKRIWMETDVPHLR